MIISDGFTTSTWTYSRALVSPNWVTTVTAPTLSYDSAANQSTFTFNTSGQSLTEKYYQGSTSGSLLRTVNTTWTNGSPSSQTLILEDGSTQTKTDTSFDSYGNLTQKIEYAWGASTAVRTTQITYLASSSYTAKNIRNRPTQVLVRDGGTSGTIKSRIDITYDDSAYINTYCPTGSLNTMTQITAALTLCGDSQLAAPIMPRRRGRAEASQVTPSTISSEILGKPT